MAIELDAHHVEDFALVPVGALENRRDRIDVVIVLAHLRLHAQMPPVVFAAQRHEFVHHLKARFVAEMIDAGNIENEIEAELLQENRDWADDLAIDFNRPFIAEFLSLADLAGKLLLQ